ncbi:MAG: dTDP-4-dehydrorhamnose 3,5-epimerase [Vicingaceae bacterium]
MIIEKTKIEGLLIIKPRVFPDERGYFFESYNQNKFEANGLNMRFVQDNISKSDKNVLRGLHFQLPPFAQGKLVHVIRGSVLDVALDIRKHSPTYGQHHTILLSEENKTQFYVPEGFAHGFVTLEDNTIFSYKCTNLYNPEAEGSIIWNDKDLNIDWQARNPIISEKDQKAKPFHSFESPF